MPNRIRRFISSHPKAVGIGLVTGSLLALVVAAIIIANRLPRAETAESTSAPSQLPTASPSQSTEPSGTAEPSASASAGPPWHGYELTGAPPLFYSTVWGRVTVDELNVRRQPATDAPVVGLLREGDLVLVTGDPDYDQDEDREWIPIVGNGVGGWIAMGEGDRSYVEAVATPWLFGSERVLEGVVSGSGGFLAYGWARDLNQNPYEGSGQRSLLYRSEDGQTWEELPPMGGGVIAAATGSAGYIIVLRPSYIEPWLFLRSTDGRSWGDRVPVNMRVHGVAWGPSGPVVVGIRSDYEGDDTLVVTVDDIDPSSGAEGESIQGATFSQPLIEASTDGYVVFDRYGSVELATSTDADEWRIVAVPGIEAGEWIIRDVELVGDQVTVVVGRDDGTTRLSVGRLTAAGGIEWTDAIEPFGEATVDSISAGNGGLLALGWDRRDLVPLVWRSTDGRTWGEPAADPSAFGGAIGPEPAFGSGQWVGIGDGLHESPNGRTWTSLGVGRSQGVAGPGCPPADQVTTLDLLFLGGAAADCFGDTPLTLKVWIPMVDGLGGCCWPESTPGWLTGYIPPAFIAPGPTGYGGSLGVYPSPDVDGEFVAETWARVTGHFHDPAAGDCRHIPLTGMPQRLEAPAAIVDDCERRFVIDVIEPIEQ